MQLLGVFVKCRQMTKPAGTMNEEPVLTQKGQEQARELGKWLKEQTIDSIDAVVVSPLPRAQHTLELAREVAGWTSPD